MIAFVSDPLHPVYKKVLRKAAALGYTVPTHPSQLLQSGLITKLINNNLWESTFDVFYVLAHKSGTSLSKSFACINWINPDTFLATLVNNTDLTYVEKKGIHGATTGYIDTGFNMSTSGTLYTQNSAGVYCYITEGTAADSSMVDFGVSGSGGSGRTRLRSTVSAGQSSGHTNCGTATTGAGAGIGFWHLQRTSSTFARMSKNGTSIGTSGIASQALPNQNMYICMENQNGSSANPSTRTIGTLALGGPGTGNESLLSTIITSYITDLNAL